MCLIFNDTFLFNRVDFVRLGEQTFNQTKDCNVEKEKNETSCADPPVDIPVQKIFIHPRYEEVDDQKVHDIALIRLAEKINFTGMTFDYTMLCLNLNLKQIDEFKLQL